LTSYGGEKTSAFPEKEIVKYFPSNVLSILILNAGFKKMEKRF